jgi:hypothetical protein
MGKLLLVPVVFFVGISSANATCLQFMGLPISCLGIPTAQTNSPVTDGLPYEPTIRRRPNRPFIQSVGAILLPRLTLGVFF